MYISSTWRHKNVYCIVTRQKERVMYTVEHEADKKMDNGFLLPNNKLLNL